MDGHHLIDNLALHLESAFLLAHTFFFPFHISFCFRLGVAVSSPRLVLSFGYTKMGHVIWAIKIYLAGWEKNRLCAFSVLLVFGHFARI